MDKIKITTDSTCDLDKETILNYGFDYLPQIVNLGDEEKIDTVNLTTDDIAVFVKNTGKLPKTAARSVDDFKAFFEKYTKEGYKVVHISLSNELSVMHDNACKAADEIGSDKVFIVNSRVLSTGSSLLLLFAKELLENGKSAEEIAEICRKRAYHCQASFVVETLEYLHKGGRCSTLAMLGANLLKLKPKLQLINGKIVSTDKYRGKMLPVLKKYIDDTLALYNNPDKKRCFITHANQEAEIVSEIVEYVKSKNIFEEVIETRANGVIYSHCGKGTLGILYLNDGGIY